MKFKLSPIDYWNEYVEMIQFPIGLYVAVTIISMVGILYFGLYSNPIVVLSVFGYGIIIHYTGGVFYVLRVMAEGAPMRIYEISIDVNGILVTDVKHGTSEIVEWEQFGDKVISRSLTRYRSKNGITYLFPNRMDGIEEYIAEIDKHREAAM